MIVNRLWLSDFRSYEELSLDLADGLNAAVGANGVGKTNIVEALYMLAKLKSHRGAANSNMIRKGADIAVIRALGESDGREVLVEIELSHGRTRAQINKQRLASRKAILGTIEATVFAPDDLGLIKEGPSIRREYIDDTAVSLSPRDEQIFSELEKILKQRNSLLKQMRGGSDVSAESTLEVWDKRLAEVSNQVVGLRLRTVQELKPYITSSYQLLSGSASEVGVEYSQSWEGDLFEVLLENHRDDIRRAVTSVGPHRDEIVISLDGLSSRTESSQGEQRTLSLSLRLASHRLLTERLGEPPLLLLDDVLSELDADRSVALLDNLPKGQTLITSAVELPPEIKPDSYIVC